MIQIRKSDLDLRLTTACYYAQNRSKKHPQNNALTPDLALAMRLCILQKGRFGHTESGDMSSRTVTG